MIKIDNQNDIIIQHRISLKMNIFILCCGIFSLIVVPSQGILTNLTKGVKHQLVKTCCRNSEVFSTSTKGCVFKSNDALSNKASKTSQLYPYLGNWKHKKTPNISHRIPSCGLENYKIVENRKKISLNENVIEISRTDETENSTNKEISQIEFKYYSDYCVELASQNGNNSSNFFDGDDKSGPVEVIRVSCESGNKIKSVIRLCCNLKERYDQKQEACRSNYVNESDTVDAYTILDDVPRQHYQTGMIIDEKIDTTFVFSRSPYCLENQQLRIIRHQLVMYDNGNIDVDGNVYGPSEYCVSDIRLSLTESTKSNTPQDSKYQAWIKYCEDPWWYNIWYGKVIPALHITSNIFLLSLLAYILIEKGHTIFGATMVAIIFNLFSCYLCVTVVLLWGKDIPHEFSRICFIGGVMIYFSYLSILFWLNCLCFDVWSSFHRMKAPKRLNVNESKIAGFKDRKFKKYALYGWGMPMITTTLALTMQLLPSEFTTGITTPDFAKTTCFLENRKVRLYYQFIPAGIALVISLGLFVSFVWSLCCGVWANQRGDPSVR